MDRDRDRDRRPRDRDFPPDEQYRTPRGESYRPGNARDRSPSSRIDSYRARSPPRGPDYGDSYKADTYRGPPRGRSRTPPRRDDYRRRSPVSPRFRDREPRGGDSYRVRPRSRPPRREDLPRDDLFRREPARDDRDFRDQRDYRDERDRGYGPGPRSPPRFRDRSPMPLKRMRDLSPISSRGRRTPPPAAKRERLASPPRGRFDDFPPSRGVSPPRRRFTPDFRDRRPSPPRAAPREYRPRSRTPPPRNERIEPRIGDDWRRPRSPARESRADHPSREESAQASGTTSRRSSPPIHPSRTALQQPPPPLEERLPSNRPSPREPYENRESHREPAPVPEREANRTPKLPAQSGTAGAERNSTIKSEPVPSSSGPPRPDETPTAPRNPPTGPGAFRGPSTPAAPPSGPAAASRASGAPPTGPRGASAPRGDFTPRGRGGSGADFAPRGRGGFGTPFRGGRGGAPASGPSFNRSEQSSATESTFPARGPPSGPRSSISQSATTPSFRSASISNATPTTVARSQRFGPNGEALADTPPTGPRFSRRPTEPAILAPINRPHPALADLPKPIDGGHKAEPLLDRTKLSKLEGEAEKLRKQIEERETRKRKNLRDWDRMARDTEAAALRSALAEEALKQLNGEAESQAAF